CSSLVGPPALLTAVPHPLASATSAATRSQRAARGGAPDALRVPAGSPAGDRRRAARCALGAPIAVGCTAWLQSLAGRRAFGLQAHQHPLCRRDECVASLGCPAGRMAVVAAGCIDLIATERVRIAIRHVADVVVRP